MAHTYTAFSGARRLVTGSLEAVAVAARRVCESGETGVLIFSDATGSQIDLDLRGSEQDVSRRYRTRAAIQQEAVPRGRGRPRLGVVSREVTLLPEHWEWLASQPGGASVALRKLVQQARRDGSGRDRLRRAQERAYKVMVAIAGDRAGFEEATRALFADDPQALRARIEGWPPDIREHVLKLADPDYDPSSRSSE